MDCNKIISLYLKGYISDEHFENIFYDYIDDFQNTIEDIYLNILFTNFSHKEEIISLETELHNYILKNYKSLYESINDAYVERMIDSNNRDAIEDLIYDVIFPEKLVFYNWRKIDKKLPQDTAILKAVLDRNCNGRCIIIYV